VRDALALCTASRQIIHLKDFWAFILAPCEAAEPSIYINFVRY
jgi:hypothetical protein